MPDEIRVNRPQGQMPAQNQMRQDTAMHEEQPGRSRGAKIAWIILAVIVVVLIILGVLFRDRLFHKGGQAMLGASGYQAVFLTNGQVYFGKLSHAEGNYLTLDDIYYLQVVQPPLQGSQPQDQAASQQQPQISLVKLGNELHGPVDEMHISREQVLFYEDLKSDGQVVKAIEAYKANPSGTVPTPGK
ncbi:MAG TPA: hypothetical protein VHA30_03150 [Patescibacteria group bacterium]|nr:hypothetical protein [Patescibacteria group bacterium]